MARSWLVGLAIAQLALSSLPPLVHAAEAPAIVLKAQLIWGTDDLKPKDKELKEVDPKLRERLKSVFKWKNYFQVSEKKIEVPRKTPVRVRMSPKCEVEVRFVEDATLEMKLVGEGKHVGTLRKATKAIEEGQLAVLAGDDKDKYGDAWFVVVSTLKP